MTSFGRFFKATLNDKFRSTNFILLINIMAIFVSIIWSAVDGNFSKNSWFQYTFSWSFLAILIVFIRLTVLQERIYTRDSYRLVPIGDIKFYLANLASSFVGMIYALAVEFVMYFITIAINWDDYSQALKMMAMMNGQRSNFEVSQLWGIVGMWMLMMLALMLLTWTTINLIHLLSRTGSNFLPSTGRRILNVVVYIVVIWAVLRIVSYIMSTLNNSVNMLSNSSDIWSFLLYILIYVVVAALEAAGSIYLLHNWVETVSES